MSVALLAAAMLAIALGVAHSILGERYILVRLFRRSDLPHLLGSDWFTRRTLRFAWHLTSLAWFGFAAVLLVLAREGAPDRPLLLRTISATFLISAAIAAGATRGRHLAWIVFLAIGALAWNVA
ncbi:MAG: hypothetical protein ACYC7A_00385 [Thermoanaerobaculia bacterium]